MHPSQEVFWFVEALHAPEGHPAFGRGNLLCIDPSRSTTQAPSLSGIPTNAGVILQALPQNPRDPRAEKGPSTFDITQAFSLSLIWAIPLDRVGFLQPLGQKLVKGWKVAGQAVRRVIGFFSQDSSFTWVIG